MTASTDGRRAPGSILLKIAGLLLNEHTLAAVVQPTIADLQREVAAAGAGRLRRLRARWRGYCAYWTLMLIVPFASIGPQAREDRGIAFPDSVARLAFGSVILTLLVVAGRDTPRFLDPALAAWLAGVTAAGALFAILIHAWYARHPSEMPAPPEPQTGTPQINFSSTEVAGNIGGLIFAIGTVLIVALGVPSLIWFLLAASVSGGFLAWALVAWHASHPRSGLPANQIVLR